MNKPNRKFSPKPTGGERNERPRRPRTNDGSRAAGFSDKRYSPILDPDDNKEWKQRDEAGRRYRPASGEQTDRRGDSARGNNAARRPGRFSEDNEGGSRFKSGERSGFRKEGDRSDRSGGINRRSNEDAPRGNNRRSGEGKPPYNKESRSRYNAQDSDGTGRPYRAPREDGHHGDGRQGDGPRGNSRYGASRSGENRYGNNRNSDSPRSYNRRNDDEHSGESRFNRSEDARPARSNTGRRGESRFESPKRSTSSRRDDTRGNDFRSDGPRGENRAYRSEGNTSGRTQPAKTRSEVEGRTRTPFKKKDLTDAKSVSTATPPTYDFSKIKGKAAAKAAHTDAIIRLNKYIADAGICSRRDADELIATGQIKVNGEVITQMGHKVSRNDTVTYNGRKINPEKLVYVLLNKPKDFITTTEDPQERRTVMQLVDNAADQRIYPVGRLDRNTTGLLLLTNDGELAEKLSHPSHQIKKVYQALLDKPLAEEDLEKIQQGLVLEDGPAPVNEIGYVTPDKTVIGLEIHIGRNRIVRRIFESLGYDVIGLDRVIYAGLTKKDLPRGNWRYLTEKEVIRLKHFS